MNNQKSRASSVLLAKICFVLASAGAVYLLLQTNKAESCCDAVLKTRWAYILPGIPVTVPALAMYLFLLVGLFFKPQSEIWKGVFLVGALTVLGAAVWFTGLQMFHLKSICPWCMAVHAVGAIGAVFLLRAIYPIPKELVTLGVAGAGMGLAMLAACQYFLPQSGTAEMKLGAGIAGKLVPIPGGLKLDTRTVPSRGNAESDRMVIVFFDYTCSSCRRVHDYLHRAEERFGIDNYYVVMVPTPLNPDCNRHFKEATPDHRNACSFASMALALWSIDREKFYVYDRWMIETGSPRFPPEADAARAKAEELVGKQALDKALADPQIAAKLAEVSEIWNNLKEKSGMAMPKMLWSNGSLNVGAPRSEFELFELMGRQLGLTRKN